MRKLALVSVAACGVVLLSGCMYALNKTNMPSTEKIKVVPAAGDKYAFRIENHGETAVPPDGKIDLNGVS